MTTEPRGGTNTEAGRGKWSLGRWPVRLLALAGCVLLALASIGWWLDTRVVDADGFGDVVAKASQRPDVRDYVADQATLRLARESNFVSAARPVVSNALSQAIATDPVEDAVHAFARRAHQQVFRARHVRRVDLDAQQAATTIRSALHTINPDLSEKLPANVLDASATISQNRNIDTLFRVSRYIWVWIPIGLLGIGLLVVALARARERVRALRTVGMMTAVTGAFLAGFGTATPALAAVVGGSDVGRGDAIAAFVAVLTGRLVGAGLALLLIGLAVALAPGRDGGDLRFRAERARAWVGRKRESRWWRFAGGLALAGLATLVLTRPAATAGTAIDVVAVVGIYLGVVVCLRASGLLVTDHTVAPLPGRQLAGVLGAMVAGFVITSATAIAIVDAASGTPSANPDYRGCEGYVELCVQPLDQVVWPGSHNAMSSAAYNFFSAEHTITVSEQLNAGARLLMLDAYYGYDDGGLVRTNLAGGVDRARLRRERGQDAVQALDRLGALTGTADTSGERQDVYFCHDFCELGAVPAVDVLTEVRTFLERNLTEVVILDVEDYVRPADLRQALVEADLFDRVQTVDADDWHELTLLDLVRPRDPEAVEVRRRLLVMSENHGGEVPWLPDTYSVFEETPYTFTSINEFDCEPERGAPGNPLLLVNHWLRPSGPPDPVDAGRVNDRKVLTARFEQCIARRGRLPNVVAVDFTEIGDLYDAIRRFNGAVARVTGAIELVDRVVGRRVDRGDLTTAEAAEIEGTYRLPRVRDADARALLGAIAATLAPPPGQPDLEQQLQSRE